MLHQLPQGAFTHVLRSSCGRVYQAGVEFLCSALTNFPLLSAPLLCHSRRSTIRSYGSTGRWCCRLGFRKIYHDGHAMQPLLLSVLNKCATYHSEDDLHDAAEGGSSHGCRVPEAGFSVLRDGGRHCDWVRRLDPCNLLWRLSAGMAPMLGQVGDREGDRHEQQLFESEKLGMGPASRARCG